MCGIVGVKRKDNKPAYKAVLKRYRAQKQRGSQGFGYVAIQNNKVVSYKRAATEAEIIKMLEKETAPEIYFHHRFPTSTPNVEESAHPLYVEHENFEYQYYWLHNGVIRNDDELKKAHEKMGLFYTTEMVQGYTSLLTGRHYPSHETKFNDSECVAFESSLAIEGKKTIDTEGSAAVIGVQVKDGNVLNRIFYRNSGHPLNFYEDKDMIVVTTLGAGKLIPEEAVMRLKEGGGIEPFREGLKPPSPYKITNVYGGGWGKDRVWDSKLMQYVDTPKTPLLPERRDRGMGFHQRNKEEDDEEISYAEDAFEYPSDDLPFVPETAIIRNGKAMSSLNDHIKKGAGTITIAKMSDGALWTEYEKVIAAEVTLKKEIKETEDLFDENPNSDFLFEKGLGMQNRLARLIDFGADLWDEIEKREQKIPISQTLSQEATERMLK